MFLQYTYEVYTTYHDLKLVYDKYVYDKNPWYTIYPYICTKQNFQIATIYDIKNY